VVFSPYDSFGGFVGSTEVWGWDSIALCRQFNLSQDAEFAPSGFSVRVFSAHCLQLIPQFFATLSICSQK
jgi:hypothetical protein